VCDSTSAPSYYTPRELTELVMCPQCFKYSAFISWYLNFEETIAALKKIKNQRENKAIVRSDDVMVLRKSLN